MYEAGCLRANVEGLVGSWPNSLPWERFFFGRKFLLKLKNTCRGLVDFFLGGDLKSIFLG